MVLNLRRLLLYSQLCNYKRRTKGYLRGTGTKRVEWCCTCGTVTLKALKLSYEKLASEAWISTLLRLYFKKFAAIGCILSKCPRIAGNGSYCTVQSGDRHNDGGRHP
jgi:hypothetical protein